MIVTKPSMGMSIEGFSFVKICFVGRTAVALINKGKTAICSMRRNLICTKISGNFHKSLAWGGVKYAIMTIQKMENQD